jgi:transmembrane protein 17
MLRRPPELPRSVNDRLNRLATSFFTSNDPTDLKQGNNIYSKQSRIEIDYSSSLPLQMLLYFNICFFPCWLFSLTFVLPVLALSTNNQNVILMVFAFVFKAIIECVRLYLGYAGNLAERMPELTAFCLLTIIFQVPLTIFLLIYQLIATIEVQMSLIFAVEIIYLTFLALEAAFGISAVRIMVTAQSSRFYYRQI